MNPPIFCIRQNTVIGDKLGLAKKDSSWNSFAREIAKDECWFSHLDGVRNLAELRTRIFERITAYRSYLNFNSDELEDGIVKTKTIIGVPVSRFVQALRSCGACNENIEFLIRIDQYEELFHLEGVLGHLGLQKPLRGMLTAFNQTKPPTAFTADSIYFVYRKDYSGAHLVLVDSEGCVLFSHAYAYAYADIKAWMRGEVEGEQKI